MKQIDKIKSELLINPKVWLITGGAGFIGSNLLHELLRLDQIVIGLDNFSTGFQENLDEVRMSLNNSQWARFKFIKGDVCSLNDCKAACNGVDYVLHQAALGSVPRSLADPISSNNSNITGFLNMLVTARDEKVKSFTYAASSSTYGDFSGLTKTEENIGNPLNPYGVTKLVNELYADVFFKNFNFNAIGLRYFNVFGRRQNPDGAYAAVIPRWIFSLLNSELIYINGDGETSRDFTYIENVIQANILAATKQLNTNNRIFNVAVGESTTLNELFYFLRDNLKTKGFTTKAMPIYREFRPGDIRHSLADISKAKAILGYEPTHNIQQGIHDTLPWYISKHKTIKSS